MLGLLAAGPHRTMPEGATALEIPSYYDRPAYVTRLCYGDLPAATAIHLPPQKFIGPPTLSKTYLNFTPDPELEFWARRFAFAYITPADAPARAEPGPFIRLVFRTLALDLPQTFELFLPLHGADATVRFRTPDDREAAMRRQPFQLDGATVKLLREGETPDIRPASNDYMVHAALHQYPVEQRTGKKIESNCCHFGHVREVDPTCFAKPDLGTVHVVLQLEHPGEIPHALEIEYIDGSISIVPVDIVTVWHSSHSYDAHGQYVRIFQAPAAAA
jgi:hypothetical protein